MKIRYLFYAAVISTAFSCKSAPDSDKAETTEAVEVTTAADGETWKVDPSSSTVKWVGTKVSGYHVGTINISDGEIKVKDGNVTGGKISMDMKTLAVTGPSGSNEQGNEKLKGHLTSADFFDVEKYPEAIFEITSVTPSTDAVQEEEDPRQSEINEYKVTNPTHRVSGNLTMKGVTKNIEFPARITQTENSVDAVAKFNIDRSQWNITYPGKPDDLIKNEVHMGISLKASK
jgi:polyisoprenoid-binding protein YceI